MLTDKIGNYITLSIQKNYQTINENQENKIKILNLVMTKKETAIDFLKMLTSQQVDEAFEKHIHAGFIHHNMHFAGDRNSFHAAIKSGMQNVKTEFVVLRALEDNNLVAIHAKVKFDNATNWIALVHFFKFEDGKIIEEWEVSNEVADNIPNENGAF